MFEIVYWMIQLLLNFLSGGKLFLSKKENTRVAGCEGGTKQISDEAKCEEEQIETNKETYQPEKKILN